MELPGAKIATNERTWETSLAKILVIEDDVEFSREVSECLRREQHDVEQAYDGEEALAFLNSYKYDLVVLDWELPGASGIEICKRYRQAGGSSPILMLTGKGTIADKECGFETGVDDYLTKPPHLTELRARVKALLRRPPTLQSEVIEIRHVKLDCNNRTVTSEGNIVELLPREFALLEFLMKHPTRIFSPDELIAQVWPSETAVSTEVVRNTVNRIRKRVDTNNSSSLIRNVYSVGYGIDSEGIS